MKKEWNYLGRYYFQTESNIYNVEFTNDKMEIRGANGKFIESLERDRSIGGVSDGVILKEWINNL